MNIFCSLFLDNIGRGPEGLQTRTTNQARVVALEQRPESLRFRMPLGSGWKLLWLALYVASIETQEETIRAKTLRPESRVTPGRLSGLPQSVLA